MRDLLLNGYTAKLRPSGHNISTKFGKDNGGAVPPNLLAIANTESNGRYQAYCKAQGLQPHPARFPPGLPEYFVRMLTDRGDTVLDPFAGSCVTGEVCSPRSYDGFAPRSIAISSTARCVDFKRPRNGGPRLPASREISWRFSQATNHIRSIRPARFRSAIWNHFRALVANGERRRLWQTKAISGWPRPRNDGGGGGGGGKGGAWLPAVKSSFTPLERTRDVYPWDPV